MTCSHVAQASIDIAILATALLAAVSITAIYAGFQIGRDE